MIFDEMFWFYFFEDKVLFGLFEVVYCLYGLKIIEQFGIDMWYNDVCYFIIIDDVDVMCGSFYLDLYV